MASRPRIELQELLVEILGSRYVYFQPPAEKDMLYPCIRYKRDDAETDHANNLPYNNTKAYQVIVIDPDPDSLIPDKIAALPLCKFERHYSADNLNHDVFTLFF